MICSEIQVIRKKKGPFSSEFSEGAKMAPDPPGIASGGKPDSKATNTNKVYQTYEYNQNDASPFRVIVQLLDDDEGRLRINKLSLGKVLSKIDEYKQNITNMRALGRNKVLVFLRSCLTANKMQADKMLRNNNYKAYIPRSFVSVSGVVAGVPTDMTIEEIQENISSCYPILAINRLHRYESGKKIEAHRISVTFRASTLPPEVRLFCCINTVRPFITKPVLCLNCLRYNHATDNCRSRKRCPNCTQQHEGLEFGDCPNKAKCLYCKDNSNHRTSDEECAEKKRQRNIRTIMAKSTLTFMEAKEQFPILTENRYELLENAECFPPLPNTFAEMSAGQYKTKNVQQCRPQKPKRTNTEVNIADQVQVYAEKKKKKVDGDKEKEQNGVALFNTFKVTDFERWAQRMEEQRKVQLQQQLGGDQAPTLGSTEPVDEDMFMSSSGRKHVSQHRRNRSRSPDQIRK